MIKSKFCKNNIYLEMEKLEKKDLKKIHIFNIVNRIFDETLILNNTYFVLNHNIDYFKKNIKIGSMFGIDIILKIKL